MYVGLCVLIMWVDVSAFTCLHSCVWFCVCVCVRERERERGTESPQVFPAAFMSYRENNLSPLAFGKRSEALLNPRQQWLLFWLCDWIRLSGCGMTSVHSPFTLFIYLDLRYGLRGFTVGQVAAQLVHFCINHKALCLLGHTRNSCTKLHAVFPFLLLLKFW